METKIAGHDARKGGSKGSASVHVEAHVDCGTWELARSVPARMQAHGGGGDALALTDSLVIRVALQRLAANE